MRRRKLEGEFSRWGVEGWAPGLVGASVAHFVDIIVTRKELKKQGLENKMLPRKDSLCHSSQISKDIASIPIRLSVDEQRTHGTLSSIIKEQTWE